MRKPVLALAAMLLVAGCAPYASVGYGTGYNGFNVGTGVNLYPGGYYGAPGFGSGAKQFFGTLGGAALGGWAGSGIGGGTGKLAAVGGGNAAGRVPGIGLRRFARPCGRGLRPAGRRASLCGADRSADPVEQSL